MKKVSVYLGLALLAMTFSTEVEAQLSDRVNNPSTIKAGARPVAGNFGFYLGLGLNQIEDLTEEQTKVENAIPLINVRYYLSDDLVIRGGISMWKKSRTLEGEIDTVVVATNPNSGGSGVGATYEHREVDAWTLLHIGVEKHFKASNILDGYVGASFPVGYARGNLTSNINGTDGTTDFYEESISKFSFVYGAELFIGANAFVADLPLSIGVELGLRGIGVRGEKYKHEYEGSAGGTTYSGEFYTSDIDQDEFEAQGIGQNANGDDIEFESLKARRWDTQSMIRFTIAYYFN